MPPAPLADRVESVLRQAGVLVDVWATRCGRNSVQRFVVTSVPHATDALRRARIPTPLPHPLGLRAARGETFEALPRFGDDEARAAPSPVSGVVYALGAVGALAIAGALPAARAPNPQARGSRTDGSAARRSFAQRLAEFGRASIVLNQARSGEWPHAIYGKNALTLFAHAYSADEFRRIVAWAVEASDRGLVEIPAEIPPAPPKRLWSDLDAAYARERAKPIVFEPVRDLGGQLPGIRAVIGEGRYDSTEIGFISRKSHQFDEFDQATSCWVDLAHLHGIHGPAPVVEIIASTIRYAILRGKGLGRALYDALLEEDRKHFPKGFYLVPNECGQGATSADANRVWSALRRRFPHCGLVVFVPPSHAATRSDR